MPLSKQAKALYEAALRRKGLPIDRMNVQHITPEFVGPRQMKRGYAYHPYFTSRSGGPDYTEVRSVPVNIYWGQRGRYQDLEDEMGAAIDAGRYERTAPFANEYYRYFNDGDFPTGAVRKMEPSVSRWGYKYDDPKAYVYEYPSYGRQRKTLTGLGEAELEAVTDANIVEDYKNYLRQMYGGKIKQRPPKYGVRVYDRLTHEPLVSEYYELDDALKGLRRNRDDYGSAYLEEIWPE